MGTHYIGTSGFSYKDWVGPFYPEGLQKSEFLSYYARRFSFTELNFTYYRMPGAATLERMASKVPEGFRFTVKAPGSLTHQREAGWREDCTQYRKALEPLQDTGTLAGILMQFPYSFHYTRENRSYLDDLTEEIGDLPIFVEFRNDEWDRESVLEGLRNRSVGVVVTDHPALPRLPGLKRAVTGQQAYFRFHGRNKANWWTGDSTSRYDYLYSKEELEERLPDVLRMKQQSRQLYIAFNNHHKGQATQNAFEFAEMLEANETAGSSGSDKDSTP